MEGNSGRTVGIILGISKNTCLYWIKNYAKEIEPKNTPNGRVIVGYDIAFDKNRERIQLRDTYFTIKTKVRPTL